MLQLKHIDAAIARRQEIDSIYRNHLGNLTGIRCLDDAGEKVQNHAYFPILLSADYPLSRDALYQKLKDHEIFARRYFYPLISEFPMYRGLPSANPGNLPTATRTAQQVLCLPIYPALQEAEQKHIIELIVE